MNYKAKLLRQEIAGLEIAEQRHSHDLHCVESRYLSAVNGLESCRSLLEGKRAELAHIEGLTASVQDLTGRRPAG